MVLTWIKNESNLLSPVECNYAGGVCLPDKVVKGPG
jgi:hypothetical protein